MAPINAAKLTYFNGRGRAEICRWTLAQAGVEFEDYRLKEGEWATVKPTSPTTMAPFAEFDGKVLASSQAISAYVAKLYSQHNIRLHSHQTSISDNFLEKQKSVKFKRAFWFLLKFASKLGVYTVKFLDATDMGGSNDWEEAEIRMAMDLVLDTVAALIKFMFCKDEAEKESHNKTYCETALPRMLKFTESRLDGGKQWLVGDKISMADLAVVQFLYDHTDDKQKEIINANSAASGLISRITQLPNIKRWLEKRPESTW